MVQAVLQLPQGLSIQALYFGAFSLCPSSLCSQRRECSDQMYSTSLSVVQNFYRVFPPLLAFLLLSLFLFSFQDQLGLQSRGLDCQARLVPLEFQDLSEVLALLNCDQ